MELFVVNRYVGDEAVGESAPKEDELQKIFLKKIKQRKRLSKLSIQEENGFLDKKQRIVKEHLDNNEGNILEGNDNLGEFKNTDELTEKGNEAVVRKIKKKNVEVEEHDSEDGKREENVQENGKTETSFLVLGNVNLAKREKGKRKLPNWLANPSVVSVDLKNLTCTVDSIPELDKIFQDKLKENNITHFFPVQSQVIPWLLRNANRPSIYWYNDICVSAPTGSGKTLAFVLPILQCLYRRIVPKVRALVVLPVQELALQVYKVFKTYSEGTDLNILLFSRKVPFEEEQSLICKNDGTGKYSTSVDIIVTTPGRLVDHLTKTKGLRLDDLTYLVIDEADRVMEDVQNDWLYHLNKCLTSVCTKSYQIPVISYDSMTQRRKLPHKLLFSATLSQDPEKLQQLGLFQPKLFTSVVKTDSSKNDVNAQTQFIGKYTTPAELKEYFIPCTKMNKPLILHNLIATKSWKNVLCFVNSASSTERLAFVLKVLCSKNIKISRLSADLTIKKRNSILEKFSTGKIDVYVDPNSPHPEIRIQFDMKPIHQIGRISKLPPFK